MNDIGMAGLQLPSLARARRREYLHRRLR